MRWIPQPDQIASDSRPPDGKRKARESAAQTAPAKMEKSDFGQGTLWVPDGKYVKPIKVRLGPTDGSNTEIQSQNLQEGMQVVVGEQQKENEGGTTGSPFAPQIFKKR